MDRWRWSFFLILSVFYSTCFGQVSYEGTPFFIPTKSAKKGAQIILPSIASLHISTVTPTKSKNGIQFAVVHDTTVNILKEMQWTIQANKRVGRLSFVSSQAKSIYFLFKEYLLTEGSKLFVYNTETKQFLGAFDHRNNKQNRRLNTFPLNGEKVIIEIHQKIDNFYKDKLVLAAVGLGFKTIAKSGFDDSGVCNVNVECELDDDYQNNIKSVGLVINASGGRWCSGSVIGNTSKTAVPYFLTANHCLNQSSEEEKYIDWNIAFNYNSRNCEVNIDQELHQSISGAELIAHDISTDFALLKLSTRPPVDWDVSYAGWDLDSTAIQNSYSIHHPSGDLKKISYDFDAPQKHMYGTKLTWKVYWDEGTTEPGSSGSPLFNQDNRIIGQLYGGLAACDGDQPNLKPDYYGRFNLAWNRNTDQFHRLKDWLDPDDALKSSELGINGYSAEEAIDVVGVKNIERNSDLFQYKLNELIVLQKNKVKLIRVFNSWGKEVLVRSTFNAPIYLPNGLFILSIQLNTGEHTIEKIFIRK